MDLIPSYYYLILFGAGLTMGAGVKFERFEFDYSFTPGDSYSSESLHRISVLFKLSQ